jgi:ABC-type oligopeptide transport system substrate-binding subunit
MLKSKLTRALIVFATVFAFVVPLSSAQAAATDNTIVLSSPRLQGTEPVTVYSAGSDLVSTLDPQLAADSLSIPPVENLFLGLTDIDPKTTKIRPELATNC